MNRKLTVRRSVTAKAGGWNINGTKGYKDERTLTVGSLAASYLSDLIANKAPSDNVFIDTTQPYLRHGRFNALFRAAAREALPDEVRNGRSLRSVRTHDLRHSMVAIAIAAGASLVLIRDRCGHKDIKMTVNTYGHLLPDADERLIAKTDEAWATVTPLRNKAS